MEPKRCLILDVRTSSLEMDLRVPGNRDEFRSRKPSGLYRVNPPPPHVLYVPAKVQSQRAKTYRHSGGYAGYFLEFPGRYQGSRRRKIPFHARRVM